MRDFALENYFSKWEFTARYHLAASDIESFSIAELLQLANDTERERFASLWLGYTQTWGAPALREQIAATYEQAGARDVLCFAGAEEGVYVAMRVLLKPGDHAIVVVPNYQAAETLPLQICEVTGVALDATANWSLDVDQLIDQIRPGTRLISINFPNNPTGALIPRSDFDALVEVCDKKGIYLFSDEVYRLMEHDESHRLPQAADVLERGVSLNVMSKSYGLPGLRIGWIACRDREVLHAMERYKHYLSICNSGPSEQLAIIALQARDQIVARNRALLADNRDLLDAFFGQYQELFDWRAPDAGCVAFPRYTGGDTNAFCERLVQNAGVLLLPPKLFRSELMATPPDRFRIGFGRRNLPACLEAVHQFLAAQKG